MSATAKGETGRRAAARPQSPSAAAPPAPPHPRPRPTCGSGPSPASPWTALVVAGKKSSSLGRREASYSEVTARFKAAQSMLCVAQERCQPREPLGGPMGRFLKQGRGHCLPADRPSPGSGSSFSQNSSLRTGGSARQRPPAAIAAVPMHAPSIVLTAWTSAYLHWPGVVEYASSAALLRRVSSQVGRVRQLYSGPGCSDAAWERRGATHLRTTGALTPAMMFGMCHDSTRRSKATPP